MLPIMVAENKYAALLARVIGVAKFLITVVLQSMLGWNTEVSI